MYCNATNCVKTMIYDVAMLYIKMTDGLRYCNKLPGNNLGFATARSNVKIGPARAHESRLTDRQLVLVGPNSGVGAGDAAASSGKFFKQIGVKFRPIWVKFRQICEDYV